MPAEWTPHEATWLAWPHHAADWPGKLSAVEWVYTEIVRALYRHERVCILVENARRRERAASKLDRAGVDVSRLSFFLIPTDRSWVRDTGPLFLTGARSLAAACWRFNAWALYENWKKDDEVSERIARAAGARCWTPRLKGRRVVLEGGAIDVNGEGLLLTTEECLLGERQARNPSLGRARLEKILGDYLGVGRVLWLGRGIAGDDTHGHVDDLARFTGPRTVAACVEPDPSDANHEPLAENLRRLRSMTDLEGRPLEVVELPMPRPLYFAGRRLPASYANFYIANAAVLVPTFNDPNDRIALQTLAALFPGREVTGIHSVDLVWGFGTLHCLTQQQPAVA